MSGVSLFIFFAFCICLTHSTTVKPKEAQKPQEVQKPQENTTVVSGISNQTLQDGVKTQEITTVLAGSYLNPEEAQPTKAITTMVTGIIRYCVDLSKPTTITNYDEFKTIFEKQMERNRKPKKTKIRYNFYEAKPTDEPQTPRTLISIFKTDMSFGCLVSFTTLFGFVGIVSNFYFLKAFGVKKSDCSAKQCVIGNGYLLWIGVLNLIESLLVIMPSPIVMILSDKWQNYTMCNGLHVITQGIEYSTILLLMCASLESYHKINEGSPTISHLLKRLALPIRLACICTGFLASWIGVYNNLDSNYCKHENGQVLFRVISGFVLYVVPSTIATVFFCTAFKCAKTRRTERTVNADTCGQLQKTLVGFFLQTAAFLVLWAPFTINTLMYTIPSNTTYVCLFLGLSRTTLINIVFCLFNDHFKMALIDLLMSHFCCLPINRHSVHRTRINSLYFDNGAIKINYAPTEHYELTERTRQKRRRLRPKPPTPPYPRESIERRNRLEWINLRKHKYLPHELNKSDIVF